MGKMIVNSGTEITGNSLVYGSQKPDRYKSRIADGRIRHLLRLFGGVEIRGTKWCGKTWAAMAAAESVIHLDNPNMKTLVSADPSLAIAGDQPHVIDEWQEVPAVWDLVRHEVDNQPDSKGMFLLTGSSTPKKEQVSHSGAGRIARFDMSTMTLWEEGCVEGGVSLSALFKGDFSPVATKEEGLAFLAEKLCVGGWPALIGSNVDDAIETLDEYLEALFEVSVPEKNGNSRVARRMAQSLARNVATSVTYKTLAADAGSAYGSQMTEAAVATYLNIFKELYFIEELPGWDAPIRSKSRLRTKPKRYFSDPSLAIALLGTNPQRLLTDGQLFGLLFESLCMHDIKVFVSVLPGAHGDSLRYYQDADGLEVDFIIELRDGRWAGIEVKLGEDKVPEGVKNLNRLRKKISANPAARNPEPEFMAVITANSPFARYDAEHDVYVIPLTALMP